MNDAVRQCPGLLCLHPCQLLRVIGINKIERVGERHRNPAVNHLLLYGRTPAPDGLSDLTDRQAWIDIVRGVSCASASPPTGLDAEYFQ